MTLTIGSMFSGIGGLELGLEWAGLGPVVWQVEQDPYCRAVLAKHWPDATRYDDVRLVGASNLAPVDVICGGFPCQDISVAGRRAGLAGERSGLFYEFARIIRELRPRYAVLENVTALLADGLGEVLRELAAGGYDAEWDCVPASSVGAPHQRDRIFILAYPASDDVAWRGSIGSHQWGRQRDATHATDGASPVANTTPRRLEGSSHGDGLHAQESRKRRGESARGGSRVRATVLDHADSGRHGPPEEAIRAGRHGAEHTSWWSAEPDVGRVAHGVPARVDRLRALGNAVVPQVAEIVGYVILARETAPRPMRCAR